MKKYLTFLLGLVFCVGLTAQEKEEDKGLCGIVEEAVEEDKFQGEAIQTPWEINGNFAGFNGNGVTRFSRGIYKEMLKGCHDDKMEIIKTLVI